MSDFERRIMSKKLTGVFILFLSLCSFLSVADVVDEKLETNLKDRMQNEASIDQRKPKDFSDTMITQTIQENLRSGPLSEYGKSVKVITVHGHVTLKGRILSTQEEAIIIQKAKSVGGVTMVLNEMQIIPEKK